MPNPNPTPPVHNPLTGSTADAQAFVDPPGGLPLDHPIVQEREKQRRAKSQASDQQQTPPQ
jgi:hypothetical protein